MFEFIILIHKIIALYHYDSAQGLHHFPYFIDSLLEFQFFYIVKEVSPINGPSNS